jgi:hypothetical protein
MEHQRTTSWIAKLLDKLKGKNLLQKKGPRVPGSLKGKIHISDDFDAPLMDLGPKS